jgi:uncharacterized membrane protein
MAASTEEMETNDAEMGRPAGLGSAFGIARARYASEEISREEFFQIRDDLSKLARAGRVDQAWRILSERYARGTIGRNRFLQMGDDLAA